MRSWVAPYTCIFTLTFASAPPAFADENEKAACAEAHEQGQVLRIDGKLHDARARFLQCARATCPPIVVRDCAQWEQEVLQSQPTLVIAAQDAVGHDTMDARVSVDGALLAEHLGAVAYDVDPGSHTLRFETRGSPPEELSLVLRVGEKNRPVSVRFRSAGPTAAEKRLRVGTWVAGAGTAVGLVVFTTFAILGKEKQISLDHQNCAPGCPADQIDVAEREYNVADIGLAVGTVSAGALIWLLLSQGHSKPSTAFRGRSLEFVF
jgi:hypothetical protein